MVLNPWAAWCAPCRNELPVLVRLAAGSKQSGIVVIGVHTPGSSEKIIEAHLAQFKIEYSVCIDLPPPDKSRAFGQMYAAFGARAIPELFVINADGVVADHGSPAEMIPLALKLAEMNSMPITAAGLGNN